MADDAHHMLELARGSLSGDPYDPTAIQAYGQIIEAVRRPPGPRVPKDPQARLLFGLGRHVAADACLVYAAAQTIAADRHVDMVEALRVLHAAIDDLAAGRPVVERRRGPGPTARRHRSRHDCDVPAHSRGGVSQRFSRSDRRHGVRKIEIREVRPTRTSAGRSRL
jgi:hypothetical protein